MIDIDDMDDAFIGDPVGAEDGVSRVDRPLLVTETVKTLLAVRLRM